MIPMKPAYKLDVIMMKYSCVTEMAYDDRNAANNHTLPQTPISEAMKQHGDRCTKLTGIGFVVCRLNRTDNIQSYMYNFRAN